jgi:hypothetical protein
MLVRFALRAVASGYMRPFYLLPLILCCVALNLPAQTAPTQAAQRFEDLAERALEAMTRRAGELKIKGVALVAYIPGDTTKTWSSKMTVVGTMTNPPNEKNKGSNLLAIAYAKAAEMADTHKDSGSAGRLSMTGENGWQGGVIAKTRTGYVLAAFSGGPGEDDVKVSQAGVAALGDQL